MKDLTDEEAAELILGRDYYWGEETRQPRSYTTFDKNQVLAVNPHYTDLRFSRGGTETVFGQEEKGLFYVYSDRIWQWDYHKADLAVEVANASGATRNTAAWYESYLSAFYDKLVDLVHIVVGVNVSNGFAYQVFGFRDKLSPFPTNP